MFLSDTLILNVRQDFEVQRSAHISSKYLQNLEPELQLLLIPLLLFALHRVRHHSANLARLRTVDTQCA